MEPVWLVGAGARYGLPTADPRSLPNQGYARSQAFIRPRDKEIIYEFFEHAKYTSSDRPTAGDLFANFLFWLRNHSSQNPRLLERANDSDYTAEFCAFLPTALSYWTAQEALAIHGIQISAELLWDEVRDHFELVVDVRDAQWLTGSEVRLPNGDSYVVTFDDIYLYLFDQDVEQSVWFTDALANWPLHEKISLSWSPRRCYLLVDDGNASWVETHRFEPGKSYRILAETEKILELLAAGVLGPTEGAQIPGWEWICAVDLSEMTPEQMRRLLDLEGPVLKRPRGAAFVNGLRLGNRNHYFEGGEPDVRIGLDNELVSIFVDGRDRLSDLLPGVRDNQYLHVRLSKLALDPGDHTVVVSTSTEKSNHSLLVVAPGRSRGHDYEQDLAFQPVTRSTVGTSLGLASKYTPADSESLIFRATSSAYAVAPDGTVYTISIAAETPPWLSASGFGSDGEIEDFLETTEISLPTEEQMYQLVYRRTPRSEWCVLSPASGNVHDEFPGTRVQMVNVLPPQLLEFVAADPKVIVAKSLETVSHLKHRILTSRPPRVHASTERSRSDRFHQHREELYRADLSLGPSRVANPYNSLLDWLSEHEIGYCSLPKAEEAFRWLWCRDYPDVEVPNFFYDVLYRLADLGHVTIDRANRRLWIAPTVLSTLPNVRSLRALSGSRAIEFIAKLRTGADEFDDAATAQILQDLTLHELHQTNSQGIPMAPDLIFVQLASDIKNLAGQCSALANLGIATEVNRSVRAIEALPTLRDRLDGRLRAVLPLKSHLHLWQGSETAIFAGKWREISCLPDAGEHFVKTKVGYSTRYFWWAAGEDRLSLVDWSLGRWAYASIQAPRLLVLHRPESRQLLVVDGIPLPREIARALVGRTGTLPRSTTVHPTRATATSRPTVFNVFENISIPFAEAVAAALGQPSGPQMRTNMEIHFD